MNAKDEGQQWEVYEDENGWWLHHPGIMGLLFGEGERAVGRSRFVEGPSIAG